MLALRTKGTESSVLGLSLTKILFTILIIVVVWKGFALIGRLAREREVRAVGRKRGEHARARGPGAIDLIECGRCGAYFDPKQGCRCGHGRA
jgi:hypothetical protein